MTNESGLFDQGYELDEWITPPPLSDPVLTAIFQNAEVSGLAMRSFLNATLEDSGDKPISEVVTVTPQSIHSETSSRGFRIDVEAWTESGEIALVEVQLKPFATTIERALLYAEQALASRAKRGDNLSQVTFAMPKVIVLNILEKALRDVGGYHQIVEMLYRELPYQRATDKLTIHNLELDKYRKTDNNIPATPLQCWLTAICKSQDEKKPLMEVVNMDSELQAYYDEDPGFAQFVKRHGAVASMPEIRKAYRRYEYDLILDKLDEERRLAEMEEKLAKGIAESEAKGMAKGMAEGIAKGMAEGKAKGMAEGKIENQMEIAIKAFSSLKQSKDPDEISYILKLLDIPDDIIEVAKKQTDCGNM